MRRPSRRAWLVIVFALVPMIADDGAAAPAASAWESLPLPYSSGPSTVASLGDGSLLLFHELDSLVYRPAGGTIGEETHWRGKIDAAFLESPNLLVLFLGAHSRRYNVEARSFIGEAGTLGEWGLPATWTSVDAAAAWGESQILFFHRGEYALYDRETRKTQGPLSVADRWPGWPPGWADGVEAAEQTDDGVLHLFRRGEVLAWDLMAKSFRDEPRQLPVAVADPASGGRAAELAAARRQRAIETFPIRLLHLPREKIIHPAAPSAELEGEGTIEMWLTPEWDVVDYDPYVLAYGDGESLRYGVLMTGDRKSLCIESKERSSQPQRHCASLDGTSELATGRLYHVALVVRPGQVDVHVDGVLQRSIAGFELGSARNAPLSVGSVNGSNPFVGRIGGVRIWTQAQDPALVDAFKLLPDAQQLARPQATRLAVYLRTAAAASVQAQPRDLLVVREPQLRPDGLWLAEGEAAQPKQVPATRSALTGAPNNAAEHAYQPLAVHDLRMVPGISDLMREALVDRIPMPSSVKAAEFLVDTISRFGDEPRYEIYYQAAPGRFVDPWNPEYGYVADGEGRLRAIHGGPALVRPRGSRAEDLPERSLSDLGMEIQPTLAILSRAWDVAKLDPFDLQATGSTEKVFGNMHLDARSARKYHLVSNHAFPYGVFAIPKHEGAGSTDMEEAVSAEQYHQAVSWNVTGQYATLTRNQTIASAANRMYSNKSLRVHQESYWIHHVAVLDPANATLSKEFEDAVFELAKTPHRDFARFRESWGTHYAHSIAYGASIYLDEEMSASEVMDEYQKSNSQTWGVRADVFLSLPFGGTQLGVNHEDTRVKSSSRQNFESQMHKKSTWRSRGGLPGATFDGWRADPSAVVPLIADLRTLDELLTPHYFRGRPDVFVTLRRQLHDFYTRELEEAELNATPALHEPECIARERQDVDLASDVFLSTRGAELKVKMTLKGLTMAVLKYKDRSSLPGEWCRVAPNYYWAAGEGGATYILSAKSEVSVEIEKYRGSEMVDRTAFGTKLPFAIAD